MLKIPIKTYGRRSFNCETPSNFSRECFKLFFNDLKNSVSPIFLKNIGKNEIVIIRLPKEDTGVNYPLDVPYLSYIKLKDDDFIFVKSNDEKIILNLKIKKNYFTLKQCNKK